MKRIKFISLMLLASVLIFTSCKKEDVGPESNTNSFKVRMTDGPASYTALDVQITKVEAYLENSGWITLNNEVQYVSVLDLTNGAETTLAYKGNVKSGVYTKLRLTFGQENSLEFNGESNDGTIQTDLQWNSSKEVIIEINEEVSAGAGASVLLDFQVAQSIIEFGENYIINPVITVIEDASTGVQGRVEGAVSAMIQLSDGQNTVSTYTDAEGNFLIRGIDGGLYELVATTEQEEQTLPSQFVMEGVLVTDGKIESVGIISF